MELENQKAPLSGWARIWRALLLVGAMLVSLLLLVVVTQVAVAQGGSRTAVNVPAADVGEEKLERAPDGSRVPQDVTRIQTVTLVTPADPLATELATHWQNDWRGFIVPMEIGYPTDVPSTALIVSTSPPTLVVTYLEPTHTIFIDFPTSGETYDVYMEYTTTQKSYRLADSNLIDSEFGGSLSTGYFVFTATFLYDYQVYDFEWASSNSPEYVYTRGPGWVKWVLEDVVSFRGDVILRDTRVRADLVIEEFSVQPMVVQAGVPATVRVVVRNLGDVIPDRPYFFTEWYARPSYLDLGPPTYAGDHDYGWCANPPDCDGPGRSAYLFDSNLATSEVDPYYNLLPHSSVVMTRSVTFLTAGDYDLYAQVDVDVYHEGLEYGLNLETNESNNVFVADPLTLVVLPGDWRLYLPIVSR